MGIRDSAPAFRDHKNWGLLFWRRAMFAAPFFVTSTDFLVRRLKGLKPRASAGGSPASSAPAKTPLP